VLASKTEGAGCREIHAGKAAYGTMVVWEVQLKMVCTTYILRRVSRIAVACLVGSLWLPMVVHAVNATPADSSTAEQAGNLPGAILGRCGRAASGPGNPDVDYLMVYKSEQSMVCVDPSFWAIPDNVAAISRLFPYFDAIIALDKSLFPVVTPKRPFVFKITAHGNGGSTGCGLSGNTRGEVFCNTVSGNLFTPIWKNPRSGRHIRGFWGYLFPLHESINVFTGLLSPGWPTDWWADHRSPFPNAMDAELMRWIADNNPSLAADIRRDLRLSSDAQRERFADPSHSGYDSEVVMFMDFFKEFGGFAAFTRTFQLAINQDGLRWPAVSKNHNFTGDDNHSQNLSEYVIAYLHLGFATDRNLTSVFRSAGVGTMDGKIPSYEVDAANVKAIADAHCSIRAAANAGVKIDHELSALRKGNFQHALATGGTSASCPSECTFENQKCQAKF
jgi:hypothetical protein